VELLCGGFNGEADLAYCASCGGDWRQVGDNKQAVAIDFMARAIVALSREGDVEFVAAAEDEAVLDGGGGGSVLCSVA